MELRFDVDLARRFKSASQTARVLTQDWVGRCVYCLSCRSASLAATPQNTPTRDFSCESCGEPYELKSKSSPFGSTILDGEYETMLRTLRAGRAPNLLLLRYDRAGYRVRGLEAVHRSFLTETVIRPRRTPLPPTARRAGWLGCSIDLGGLPSAARVPIISDGFVHPVSEVRLLWSRYAFMVSLAPEARSWISDTLSCVDRLGDRALFTLQDIYAFESELSTRHPENKHIRDKLRQQLQVLVRRGVVTRLSPGVYCGTASGQPDEAVM